MTLVHITIRSFFFFEQIISSVIFNPFAKSDRCALRRSRGGKNTVLLLIELGCHFAQGPLVLLFVRWLQKAFMMAAPVFSVSVVLLLLIIVLEVSAVGSCLVPFGYG